MIVLEEISEARLADLGYSSLLCSSEYRRYFLITILLWFTCSVVYYGIIFVVPNDFGNMFTKSVVMACS